MKRFKELTEELFTEGGEMYPADEMTMKEVKIACYAANNILDRLENGAMIQRWQISAIVKASEELASVYTSMSADEVEDDMDDEWEDEMDDEEPIYVGFEYPSMYGEEVELDEGLFGGGKKIEDHHYTLINTDVNKRVGHGTVWKTEAGAKNYHKGRGADWQGNHMKVMTVGDAKKRGVPEHNFNNLAVSEEVELDENIGGLFKNAAEWESSAKARGLVVKSMTHPSGEAIKYQIAKDKEGNNRGHFDHGTKSGRLKEEVEFYEETDYEVDVEGLPKMYVKANNPGEVKTNLRKVVRNPELIRGVERVAKATLQKIFRDKATGKDTEE